MKKLILNLGLIGILGCSNPISPTLSPEKQYENIKNNEWRTEETIEIAQEKMEREIKNIRRCERITKQF